MELRSSTVDSEAAEQPLESDEVTLWDSGQLAFNFKDAAKIIGISYRTLHRLIIRDIIHPICDAKLIAREEILRFLKERTMSHTRASSQRRRNTAARRARGLPLELAAR